MADFTGKQIRNSYDRIVQFNSGSLTDALGGALSASIHQLTVDTNLVVSGSIRAEEIIVTKTSSSVRMLFLLKNLLLLSVIGFSIGFQMCQ